MPDSRQAPLPDLRRSLPIMLLRARESLMKQFRPMLIRHGITEQQWRVLRALGGSRPLDATELCERAVLLAPSLTRILRSLEERGFVRRGKDARDGRRALIALAPAGQRLIDEVTPESLAIYNRIEAAYGRERIAALFDLLDTLCVVNID